MCECKSDVWLCVAIGVGLRRGGTISRAHRVCVRACVHKLAHSGVRERRPVCVRERVCVCARARVGMR